jgi:FtsP/CotA-like multicopper oxidase with cupredoxin domain
VFTILLYTDLVLVLVATGAAIALARRARGPAPLLRRWLYVTAAVVAARAVVALLMLTGGAVLADSRLLVQVPLAVAPVAVALWVRNAVTARVAAVGVVLSVWWLLAPFGPQDTVAVLAGSLGGLAVTAALSLLADRLPSRAARLPLTVVAFLLVPVVGLVLAYRDNVTQDAHHDHTDAAAVRVDQLTGPRDRTPDVRLTLTAAHSTVRLASGATVDALTFNGVAPGPEIRVRQGQLVEVTLVNADVAEGVTVHWHGVDVPNAEDGVPGVTQDAVLPGQQHVYRFVPDRAGSFWYHTHRGTLDSLPRGLFGSFVVDPAAGSDRFDGVERTVFTHLWPTAAGEVPALDAADRPERAAVPAGREVRLRLVNSSPEPQTVHLGGVAAAVTAIDGNPVLGATPLPTSTDLLLAAGGRYDLGFTMPATPVTLALDDAAALALSPDGTADPAVPTDGTAFDPLAYGTPGPPAPEGHDRFFDLRLDDGVGFSQGALGYVSSLVNGRLYPAVPALEVDEGDRVRVRITNRGMIDHPMHLHGHRIQVLTRNGAPVTGSPWWTDTLNVNSGEVFEVAFTADNPGIWMDHCHNAQHASNGMILHLAYTGVSTPYTHDGLPE